MTPAAEPALAPLVRAVRGELADVPADRLVLVACSGGPDSVALAAAARVARDRVGALVVDHGLQADSAAIAARVAEWLAGTGLDPVRVLPVQVVDAGDGPEAAARDARYRALGHTARDLGAAAVLLGHTLDDQAETVLLGLARGSGTRSLAGMRRVRGLLRRPLLDLRREVVRAALPADAPVVDDPHNADPRFARARVRHRVLPVLEEELGPGIAEALARTADLARADADALDEIAEQVGYDIVRGSGVEGALDVADLEDLAAAVRSRVLRTWLIESGARAGSLGAAHLAEVVRLVTDWRGQGAVALPGGVEVVRERGMLCVRPTPPRKET